MTIYDRIRNRREELGMSQQELADKLGYKSRSAINKIEQGLRDINQSKVAAFANALHTTPAYLMGWVDEKEKPAINDDGLTEEQREIIELFDRADPEVQRAALDFLRAIERRENKMNNT